MEFKITIEGIDAVKRKLDGIVRGVRDFSPPLKKADRYMKQEIQRNFQTRGRTLADGWEPLSPQTVKRKGNSRILIDSGKMKKSFRSRLTKQYVEISNKMPYFKYHQSIKARKGKLPRRPMFGIKRPQEQKITGFFSSYLKTLAKRK